MIAGTLNDREDVPDESNFLGCLLLLRNMRQNSRTQGFVKFVLSHGGSVEDSPFIVEHRQRFSFKINPRHLKGALDR